MRTFADLMLLGRTFDDRLGALLNAAVDPVILIDQLGRITHFNRAAELAFGYTAFEVAGKNVSLLMSHPYREQHDGYLQRYLETGERHIIGIGREVSARRRNGETFPVELSVGEFSSNGEHGFVGLLRDITLRKQQEEDIRRTTEELRLIFENTPTAVTITDVDGRIVNANRACEALLGYSSTELFGRLHTDLTHEDDHNAIRDGFNCLTSEHEVFRQEVRYFTSGGHMLYALLKAGVARDIQGRPLMIICEIIDRSALFAAEREAELMRNELAHVSRISTLGEMISSIAHEINQPLAAISTYAGAARRLVGEGMAEPQELISVLEKIAAQAQRSGQVIRSLRSLASKRDAVREPVDCNAVILEVSRLVEFDLRARGWRLLLTSNPGLPAVTGDTVQIQQVLLNLIRNAVEAMEDSATADFVAVDASSPEDYWIEIRVSDSGPGVPKSDRERLFEPFYTTKTKGMGLGLSICRSIAVAHGGDLLCRDNERGGAEFIMRLPAIHEAVAVAHE